MEKLMSPRTAYGRALVKLGEENPHVVALSADVSNSDHSYMFADAFPQRFYNTGIAEQCLVDVAVGLAKCGKIPFANTFAFLFATRALEMVRTHLCYGKTNVKLAGAYAGLSDSYDGPTHHAISDLAIMRSLPNMTVVVPADAMAIVKMLPLVARWDGPVFFRLGRNPVPVVYDDSYAPEIGKAVVLRPGRDVTLVGTGLMVGRCLAAARELKKIDISARVLEVHTLKPLDSAALIQAATETGAVVTAEEHSVIGGLGSAVSEVLVENKPVRLKRTGIQDQFAETGPNDELLDRYGMSVKNIVDAAIDVVKHK